MLKKQIKKIYINTITIIVCVIAIFAFGFYASAQVQFTEDTIISLSEITDGDLKIASSSECATINTNDAILTVTGIPILNNFILKTESGGSPVHNNALKLTPTGGTLDLTLDSANISSGNITQWTLNANAGTTVSHIVGVASANTWYAVKTNGILFNTFQSDSSGEVSFTYNGSLSNKIFTIEIDNTNPAEFSLVSPVNNSSTSNSSPTFIWNACTDSDLSHYQLYIDNSSDTDNISGTSVSPANALSCGNHTWYIKAVDNAGNSTNSETFNLTRSCGSVPVWLLNQTNQNQNDNNQNNNQNQNTNNNSDKTIIEKIKQKVFAYSKSRLKSLFQEQDLAKDLKSELEKHYGKNKIPVNKKHWHTIVNSYIYGNYPIQAIIKAIKFGGKTVHPTIPFSAWQKTRDYLEWIGR